MLNALILMMAISIMLLVVRQTAAAGLMGVVMIATALLYLFTR